MQFASTQRFAKEIWESLWSLKAWLLALESGCLVNKAAMILLIGRSWQRVK